MTKHISNKERAALDIVIKKLNDVNIKVIETKWLSQVHLKFDNIYFCSSLNRTETKKLLNECQALLEKAEFKICSYKDFKKYGFSGSLNLISKRFRKIKPEKKKSRKIEKSNIFRRDKRWEKN